MPIRRHPLTPDDHGRGFPLDADLAARLERAAGRAGIAPSASRESGGPPDGRLAHRFYERLFQRAPGVRPLFGHDLSKQEEKLAATLAAVIEHLRSPEALTTPLRELGERHRGYGALREHYPIVVEELVGAMADVAGDGWSDEDTEDWTVALQIVSERMLGPNDRPQW